jgi:hypothetical protein
MRGWMLSAAAATLALLVTGCAAGAAGRPAARGGSGAAAGTSAARGSGAAGLGGLSLSLGDTSNSLVLPLTAYSPPLEEVADVQTDEQAVAARCMQKDGFSFPAIVQPPPNFGGNPGRGEFYDFGVTSMAFASVYGYHGIRPARAPVQALPNFTKSSAEGAAYANCYDAASRESGFAPLLPYLMLYQVVGKDAWLQALASPVVVAGFKRWSACMAAEGYDYANPIQAALGEPGDSQVPTQWNVATTAGPSQLEIQTAEADVRCKQSTGLLKQWIAAVAEDQARLVQRYLPQLQAGYAAYQKALVRLQEMAAGS